MKEYIRITELKLKVKDVFSVSDLLKVLDQWLKENYYVDVNGKTDYEELYTHALKSGGSFLDSWIWWRAVRYPEGTTDKTAYLRYRLNIDLHYLGDAAETELIAKGKKVKLNKGEVSVFIVPVLEIDFRNEWNNKGLTGLFSTLFRKRLYKSEIDRHAFGVLYADAIKLQNAVKQYFNLEHTGTETFSPPPKGIM